MKRCDTSSKLKKITKKRRILPPIALVDRLTSLPDDLLGRILSLLQTKDVAAMQVLSKRMGRALSLITSVDLDNSHICHRREGAQLVEHYFPIFKPFVVKVLQKLSSLTRFRLRLGDDKTTPDWCSDNDRNRGCFPYVEHSLLNVWIAYSLAHTGLKKLELTFHISNPNEYKLPPHLFNSRSLEIVKLDANIWISSADIPVICFPNLKQLHITSVVFTEDDFVTRLVSSCRALEELYLNCGWKKLDRITISSRSLRRLCLLLTRHGDDANYNRLGEKTDLVLIDTPNLYYFNIYDKIPNEYSISHMNALVEAELDIQSVESCFPMQLSSLLSAVSNVQHLYLHGNCLEAMLDPEITDQMPLFHNLRTIKLGSTFDFCRWHIVMPLILRSSPLLETLVFPQGLYCSLDDRSEEEKMEEAEGWRTNQILPSCFSTRLTRIEFGSCYGLEYDWNLIKYVLSKASSLKEFVISLSKYATAPNFEEFVSKLEELPRASKSCSIILEQ